MTKKHFEMFAAVIKADLEETIRRFPTEVERTTDAAWYAAQTFAHVASTDNPRFDTDRFFRACGLR